MLTFCTHLLLWLFLLLVYLVLVGAIYCLHLLALYVDSYWWLSLLVYGCVLLLFLCFLIVVLVIGWLFIFISVSL